MSEVCRICGFTSNSIRSHVIRTHKLEYKSYLIEFEFGGLHPVCEGPNCNTPVQMKVHECDGFKMYCSNECRGRDQIIYNHANIVGFSEKHRQRLLELWKDPEYRDKQSKALSDRWKDPVFREHTISIQREMWKDPDLRARMSNNFGISGIHDSVKSGSVRYRSLWEKRAYELLDENPEVKIYYAEPDVIPYRDPAGVLRNYYPDLLVQFDNSDKYSEVIEIKPKYLLDDEINVCKFNAATYYCTSRGMIFDIWTEDDLW